MAMMGLAPIYQRPRTRDPHPEHRIYPHLLHNLEITRPNHVWCADVIHRRGPWRSFEAVEYATLEWVDWFNNRRLLEPIGNIPPAEAEERYYAMLDDVSMAA